MAVQRYVEKFTNAADTISYTFVLNSYEWQSQQAFRTALAPVIGADYPYDHHGLFAAPRSEAREVIRCVYPSNTASNIEAAVKEARGEIARIGKGKLYTLDSAAARKWAWARAMASPSLSVSSGLANIAPMVFDFARLSDWFTTSQTTGSQTCDASPETFTINNPGDLPCLTVVFRFRSNGATGGTNMALTNTTNGFTFSTTRDLTGADHELKVDCGAYSVKRSTDNGANYADDYSLFTVGAGQVGFMRLEPGDNAMSYTDGGTPDLSLEWSFFAPYSH